MQAMKAMLVPILTRFLFCLALILAERGEALVIYRLGGEDLPVPEAATEEGVDFVQLFWADVDDDLFGSSHQLETSGSLIPVRLAPSVNLTPLIRERGGRIQLNNSYGWQDQPDLDFLFDGDYNTAYQGVRGDQSGSQYLKGIWIDFAGLFSHSPRRFTAVAEVSERAVRQELRHRHQRRRHSQARNPGVQAQLER